MNTFDSSIGDVAEPSKVMYLDLHNFDFPIIQLQLSNAIRPANRTLGPPAG